MVHNVPVTRAVSIHPYHVFTCRASTDSDFVLGVYGVSQNHNSCKGGDFFLFHPDPASKRIKGQVQIYPLNWVYMSLASPNHFALLPPLPLLPTFIFSKSWTNFWGSLAWKSRTEPPCNQNGTKAAPKCSNKKKMKKRIIKERTLQL